MAAKKKAKAASTGDRSFEDLLQEAESIVRELEGGTLPLEDSIERYERAVAALKACHGILAGAEERIEKLTRDADGNLATAPFDPDA